MNNVQGGRLMATAKNKRDIYRGARGPERLRKALVRSMMFVRKHGSGLRMATDEEIVRSKDILAIGPMGCTFYAGRGWFCAAHTHRADVACGFDDPAPEQLATMACCKTSVFQKHSPPEET